MGVVAVVDGVGGGVVDGVSGGVVDGVAEVVDGAGSGWRSGGVDGVSGGVVDGVAGGGWRSGGVVDGVSGVVRAGGGSGCVSGVVDGVGGVVEGGAKTLPVWCLRGRASLGRGRSREEWWMRKEAAAANAAPLRPLQAGPAASGPHGSGLAERPSRRASPAAGFSEDCVALSASFRPTCRGNTLRRGLELQGYGRIRGTCRAVAPPERDPRRPLTRERGTLPRCSQREQSEGPGSTAREWKGRKIPLARGVEGREGPLARRWKGRKVHLREVEGRKGPCGRSGGRRGPLARGVEEGKVEEGGRAGKVHLREEWKGRKGPLARGVEGRKGPLREVEGQEGPLARGVAVGPRG